jgi:hypothetical protein
MITQWLRRLRRHWVHLMLVVWALLLEPQPTPAQHTADAAAAVVRVSVPTEAVLP